MEKYQKLRVIAYNDAEKFDQIVKERKNSFSSVKTDLFINPFDSRKEILLSEKEELFFLILQQTSLLKDKLNENSREIYGLLNVLPQITQDNIFYHFLVEEIQASNDIEGVVSTRKEIREAISAVLKKSKEEKRFKSLVYQYMNFQKSQFGSINKIEEVREIYDNLLSDELTEDDKLRSDEMFRSEPVYIVDQKTGKKIHQGVSGQEAIKENLSDLVKFMNRSDIPVFEKAFVTHFFFENIHPFYDGNGRTGRFLLCSYLAKKLDYLSAVGVSVAILDNKKKYYQAFQEVSHPKNAGETTFFISDMFEILLKAQEKVLKSLKKSQEELNHVQKNIEVLSKTDEEACVLFILAQEKMYDGIQAVSDAKLAESIGISRRTLKGILEKLVVSGSIKQVKQNPSVHKITSDFWTQIQKGENHDK